MSSILSLRNKEVVIATKESRREWLVNEMNLGVGLDEEVNPHFPLVTPPLKAEATNGDRDSFNKVLIYRYIKRLPETV